MGEDNKLDTVMSKLDGLLEKLSGIKVDPGTGPNIPKARFDQVNERMKAAEDGLKAMREELSGLKASHAAELKEVRDATAVQIGQQEARHKDDLVLLKHGFDEDGRAALRTAWGRLDEKDRGESMGEWWGKQLEALDAHRKDPKNTAAPTLPRTLTPYLPQGGDGGAGGASGGVGDRQRGAGPSGVVVGRRLGVDQGVVVGEKTSATSEVASAGSWGDLEKSLARG